MARSGSSASIHSVQFDQGHLAATGAETSPTASRRPLLQIPAVVSKEIVTTAASVLSPPQSEYAIFLQSQSPKIRDGREIVETRKQRLLETQAKNLIGTQELSRPMSAASVFKRSTSPSEKAATTANVAGSDSCNIKMGDSRVFAGSNL